MFLSREIDIKLFQNYTKTYIYQILYKLRHFQIGCVIVEYDLFNTTNLIQNLIYIPFGIILTQFYINFSRQEHQIDVLYISFNT